MKAHDSELRCMYVCMYVCFIFVRSFVCLLVVHIAAMSIFAFKVEIRDVR